MQKSKIGLWFCIVISAFLISLTLSKQSLAQSKKHSNK